MLATAASLHSTVLGLHLSGDLTAGDLIVGVGTLLLAVLTYAAVRVARASLVAQDAPLLIGAHVPETTEVAELLGPANFMPPFAGLLPDGFGVEGAGGPAFVMRLWNVGRGPAVVQDVRLKLGEIETLRPMPSHVIVDAGGVHDATWSSVDVGKDHRDRDHSGALRIIYAHPNGELLETESRVDLHQRALQFRTIRRRKARRWPKSARPRKPSS